MRRRLFIQEVGDQVPSYLKRGEAGFRQLLTDFLTGKGTLEQDDWAWEELFTFVKTATQTPVRNATREWPEQLSPFVTVGRVHVPRQDISGSENSDKGDALAFNQWRVTADHRPLGEIMDVRRVYSASAKVRRTLNHQPRSPTRRCGARTTT